ncbi:hypothetical protein WISP_147538 [Willisornis vidua]|uniref:Uncharacterized protein n=1 Tax=Willisornis vidua TaxID=1566151 RepID=A0ABQ9CKG2_9PASS|nr:hypothetical protein WISP_147538 [Willisornis vidua]
MSHWPRPRRGRAGTAGSGALGLRDKQEAELQHRHVKHGEDDEDKDDDKDKDDEDEDDEGDEEEDDEDEGEDGEDDEDEDDEDEDEDAQKIGTKSLYFIQTFSSLYGIHLGKGSEENINYSSLVFPGKGHGPGCDRDYENMKAGMDYVNVDPEKRKAHPWPCSSSVASKPVEYTEVKL